MHVRFSTAIGLPVVEEATEEPLGTITGVLIHPDMGKIEGFFVEQTGFLSSHELFLSVIDILHWGARVRVRSAGALLPLTDLLRPQQLADEERPVLGQRILTEAGLPLGTCRDVQFDTMSFYLEWLFPRRFWRWGTPIPVSSIVLVRKDAIVVRDAVTLPEPVTGPSVLETLDPLGTGAAKSTVQ